MDSFMEKIVARKPSGADMAKKAGIVAAAVLLVMAAFLFIPQFALFLAFGVGFGAWWLITSMNREYEYIVTNADLDIDMIIAQRKRKRVFSGRAKDFEICAKKNGPHYKEYAKGTFKLLDFAGDPASRDVWFVMTSYKGERVMVLFEPEDRMIQSFRRLNPQKIKYD